MAASAGFARRMALVHWILFAACGGRTAIDSGGEDDGGAGGTCSVTGDAGGAVAGTGCAVTPSGGSGGSCNAGWGNCDGDPNNGCEAALDTTTNCGDCGNGCTNEHGTTSCTAGACNPSCYANWDNCDGNPNNGCETSLTTTANCGMCGTPCNLANASATCSTGTCQISSCSGGFGNCDGNPDNGCEVDTQTAVSDCGACGTACSNNNGTPSCALGSCSIACDANWGNCDGSTQSNGCEANLLNDEAHCSDCTTVCSGSTPVCTNGSCCAPGASDCDGNGSCECNTPSCCGSSCQTTHDDAFGHYFYNCDPLCNQDSNCTQALAQAACTAYTALYGGPCGLYECGTGPHKQNIVFASGASTCASWTYTGQNHVGQAYQNQTGSCLYGCNGYDNGIRWH